MALGLDFLSLITVGSVLVFVFVGVRLGWYLIISNSLTRHIKPFEQLHPLNAPRILYIGDSTGYGTGATHPSKTVPGRIGADFKDAYIENWSRGGLKFHQLTRMLIKAPAPAIPYDLVVLALGGMDIVHATPLKRMERNLEEALRLVKQIGKRVLYVGPINPAHIPLFHFPFTRFYNKRSTVWQSHLVRACANQNVSYISLYCAQNDPVTEGGHIAPDKTHPSDEGYALWYEQIRPHIHALLAL